MFGNQFNMQELLKDNKLQKSKTMTVVEDCSSDDDELEYCRTDLLPSDGQH